MRDQADNIRTRGAAYRILVAETVIIAVLALVLFYVSGGPAAVSAVMGGAAYVVPNALFARFAFRYSAAESASQAMNWFYIGEAVKIITTLVLFAACFLIVEQVNVLALFGSYAVLMLINIASLAYLQSS